jgi:hypothetical protein
MVSGAPVGVDIQTTSRSGYQPCCLAQEGVCEYLPRYLCEESDGEAHSDGSCQDVCPDLDELTDEELSACCFAYQP